MLYDRTIEITEKKLNLMKALEKIDLETITKEEKDKFKKEFNIEPKKNDVILIAKTEYLVFPYRGDFAQRDDLHLVLEAYSDDKQYKGNIYIVSDGGTVYAKDNDVPLKENTIGHFIVEDGKFSDEELEIYI